ncbi:hypothetical protein [Methylobacterium sp. P1-11]|uniref:hypothetical protein n=1 Tax=Methylobacterium sp. P1-11 TaxID=2024616 RepID=UPI0011EC846F|nr:hypothetical protein [Methylobacterium sp. P1-11]
MTEIESLYDTMMENYFELENELMVLIHREMIFSDGEIASWTVNGLISRRVINFMSTARLYIDQLPVLLVRVFGDGSDQAIRVVSTMRKNYDARLGYRVLEALRNYSQHRGYPIHMTSFGVSSQRGGSVPRTRHAISPAIEVGKLRADGKFKKSTLAELETLGEHVPFKPLVRSYVEGLNEVHMLTRSLVRGELEIAQGVFESSRTNFIASLPSEAAGEKFNIYCVELRNVNNAPSYRFIPDESVLLDHLIHKNGILKNLSQRYVTSEEIKITDKAYD